MENNKFTLKLVAIVLGFFVLLVALFNPIPTFAQGSYSLACTASFNTDWLGKIIIANPGNAFSDSPQWNQGVADERWSLVLIKEGPAAGGYPAFTLFVGKPGATLGFQTSGTSLQFVGSSQPLGKNFGRIPLTAAGAYTGSGAGTSASYTNLPDQVCGYSDNVHFLRTGTPLSNSYRKYFPFADNFKFTGANFLTSSGAEPTTPATSTGLTQTQYEETTVKLMGVGLALLTATGVVLAFRYR